MSRGTRTRAGLVAAIAACGGVIFALAGCGGIKFEENDDNLVAGKQMFVEKCGSCHVLERAGTKGTVGPDLDESFQRAVKDGFGRDSIRGVVDRQIEIPNPRGVQAGPEKPTEPAPRVVMPADLVTGKDAQDVAAYVAYAAARPGADTGALADAVEKAGGGPPIAAKGGAIDIPADPSGQLAYVTKQANAPVGALLISSTNKSSTPHDIAVEGPGQPEKGGPVVANGGVSKVPSITFKAGKYTFFCTVPGHREAGMEGTLTIK
jgi:plastocyanin